MQLPPNQLTLATLPAKTRQLIFNHLPDGDISAMRAVSSSARRGMRKNASVQQSILNSIDGNINDPEVKDVGKVRIMQRLYKSKLVMAAHTNLIKSRYLFLGWHGTNPRARQALMSGDDIRLSLRNTEWEGFYAANHIEFCLGYPTEHQELVFLRVYLPQTKYWDNVSILIDKENINNLKGKMEEMKEVHKTKRVVAYGPDGGIGSIGYEIVIGANIAQECIFLPSLHRATENSSGTRRELLRSKSEATETLPVSRDGMAFHNRYAM